MEGHRRGDHSRSPRLQRSGISRTEHQSGKPGVDRPERSDRLLLDDQQHRRNGLHLPVIRLRPQCRLQLELAFHRLTQPFDRFTEPLTGLTVNGLTEPLTGQSESLTGLTVFGLAVLSFVLGFVRFTVIGR